MLKLSEILWSEIKDALVALVHQQVEDAEVRQEATALRKHLIIRLGSEVWVRHRVLRTYCVTEIISLRATSITKILRVPHNGMDVEQLTHLPHDCLVEVNEKFPSALEERSQVIGIELKKRLLTISAAQGMRVEVAPVAVVADAHVACE